MAASQWITQIFHTFLRLIIPRHNDEMRVFSSTKNVTNASSFLVSLKENYQFVDHGVGNITVTKVEYCKCRTSPRKPEFLLVTLKESGAGRTALVMVDYLDDDMQANRGDNEVQEGTHSNLSSLLHTRSSSNAGCFDYEKQETPNPFPRDTLGDPPGGTDRFIILRNRDDATREQRNSLFDVLITMDLPQSQNDKRITLEHFVYLLQTISRNISQYHFDFAPCYWYAYTIWRILEMNLAQRQRSHPSMEYGSRLAPGTGESASPAMLPETIISQWKKGKAAEDEEWAELKKALHAPEVARREAEAACLQAEESRRRAEANLRIAEARVRELEEMLEGRELEDPTGSAMTV